MVFSDRKFIVVRTRDETPAKYDALESLITAHGGEIVHWDERTDLDVSPKLIIISRSVEYDRAEEMRRLMVPTVVSAWVHACVKEGKLVPMRPYSPDPRNFMRDVMACFSGLSPGDTDVFKAGIRASGGDFTEQVTRYSSHVVASTLDTEACQLVLQSRKNNPDLHIKLVRPEWIDDCMKLCCKVDDSPYLLDRPSTKSDSDSLLDFVTQDLTGTFPVTDTPRLAVQQSVRESLGSNILDGRRLFLGGDLSLSDKVEKTVKYLIETNGGYVESNLDSAHIYLGKWREGEEYLSASKQKGIIIGNITWLYWIMIHQKFELPTRHLLHYPEVKDGMQSMHGLVIGISNYTGDARAYLQSLIISLGAKYTGKLAERHTTHLITAYESGAKFSAAKKWGIPVVNHLWLEETYANWSRQDESQRRFTYFPKKIAMSTLIGQKQLIPAVLKMFSKPEELLRVEREPRLKRQAKQKADDWLHDAMIVESEYLKKLKDRHGKLPPLEAGYEDQLKRPRSPKSTSVEPISRSVSGEPRSPERPAEPNNVRATDSENTPDKAPEHIRKKPRQSSTSAAPSSPGRSKKPKSFETERILPRVIFSGVDDPPSAKDCQRIGITAVKTAPARILVAPRMLKTPKFLQCLADTEAFVTPAWVSASKSIGALVPVDEYQLKDEQLERALLNRSKLDGRGLLEGKTFRLQSALKDKLSVARSLIKAHLGQIATRGSAKTGEVLTVGNSPGEISFDQLVTAIYNMDTCELIPSASYGSE